MHANTDREGVLMSVNSEHASMAHKLISACQRRVYAK